MSAQNTRLPAWAEDGFAHAAALAPRALGTAPLHPLPALLPLAPGPRLDDDIRARRFGAWLQYQALRTAGQSVASTDWVLVYDPIDRIERLLEVSSCILAPMKASLTCVYRAPSAAPPSLWQRPARCRALALEPSSRWGRAPVPTPLSPLFLGRRPPADRPSEGSFGWASWP